MPITLNGTFWTLKELAEASGRTRAAIYASFAAPETRGKPEVKRSMNAIFLDSKVLIPEDEAKRYLEEANSFVYAVSTAAVMLKMQPDSLKILLALGLPHEPNYKGEPGIPKNRLPALKSVIDKYKEKGRLPQKHYFAIVEDYKTLAEKLDKEEAEKDDQSHIAVNVEPVSALPSSV